MLPAESAAALSKSAADWSALKTSAGQGTLRMETGAAETAAGICEQMIADLDGLYQRATRLRSNGSMGDCLVGQQLEAKFNAKAVGGDGVSLTWLIREHQKVLSDQAEAYRRAGAAFADQEAGNASAFGGST